MRVAAIQHDIVWEDRAATCAALEPRIAAAAADGARLVVLTEMFAVGFSLDVDGIVEPTDGPTSTWLIDQATRHGVWICGSVPERSPGADRPSNVLVLARPDGSVHRYAKTHPFTYAREDEFYEPGDALVTVDVEGVRVTLFVCYDLRFADVFWSRASVTDCYVVVANWPASRRTHWQALLRARAIENQAYVIGVNRVGSGGGLDYSGDSAIIDPLGETIASAAGNEALLITEIEPSVVTDVRTKFPFMADRRTID
jgi:predicted amidohydrolase